MWIIDETSKTETRTKITEIVNMETQEILTVATKDANRILQLIQPRFIKHTVDNKVYIIDNSDDLIGIPIKNKDQFTLDDEIELQKWLDYLNRDDNND